MNLLELSENNKKVAPWREYGYGQNSNWILKNVLPMQGVKTLLFSAKCNGETVKAEHNVHIQFNQVKYLDELPKDGKHENITEYEFKGSNYIWIKPDLKMNVLVRCSCPDQTHLFAPWNVKNKCWFGMKPKAYKKKTNRKPRNPDHLPGFCKHLSQFISYLQKHGYIQ